MIYSRRLKRNILYHGTSSEGLDGGFPRHTYKTIFPTLKARCKSFHALEIDLHYIRGDMFVLININPHGTLQER